MDKREIYNRKRALMALQRKISQEGNRRLVGREVDVLMEGPSPESDLLWQARLATQAPDIDGVCYLGDFGEGQPRAGPVPQDAHHQGARLRPGGRPGGHCAGGDCRHR